MRGLRPILLAALVLAYGCRGPGLAFLEAPLDERIELVFEGNESFTAERLTRVAAAELAQAEPELPDKASADDAAYELLLFYRGAGFPQAEVDYVYERTEDAVRVRFAVSEGPRIRLGQVVITGNQSFDAEALRGFFQFADERFFVEREVRAGVQAIRRFYAGRGFLRSTVEDPRIEIVEGTATIEVVVDEGPRFAVRELAFDGASESIAAELEAARTEFLGSTYTPRLGYEVRAVLLDLHARNGYPDCEVEVAPELDETTGNVRLEFAISKGERVTISEIRIQGNEQTDDGLIRNRIPLDPGDVYDEGRIREGFKDLYATGLFQSIQFHLAEETGSERTLVVEVVEASTLELTLEPGWGSYEGPRLRLGIEELNVLGSGRRLGLETTISPLATSARIRLTDPWFLRSRVVAETSLFWSQREEPSFTSTELGAGVNFRRQWTQELSTAAGYRYRKTRLDDVDVQATLPPEALEDTDIASTVFSLLWSDRDSLLVPTRGTRHHYQVEWASALFGSRIDFVKGSAELSPVFPLRDGTVLAGSLRTSVIVPVAGTDVIPIQERLFNGGENTVRSFEEGDLGPKDPGGEQLGGEARTIFSVELRQRVFKNTSAALFFDAGNVAPSYEDYLDFDDFRSGVGLGLRYVLPIGPIRLDLAFNPNTRNDQEDEYVLHFAVGLPF